MNKVAKRIQNIFSANGWTWTTWHTKPVNPYVPSVEMVSDYLRRASQWMKYEMEGNFDGSEPSRRAARLGFLRRGEIIDVYLRVGSIRPDDRL